MCAWTWTWVHDTSLPFSINVIFRQWRAELYSPVTNSLCRPYNIVDTEPVTAKGTGPQDHRAGVDVDVTPPTGGPVGHPPPQSGDPDCSAQGSKILRLRPCHNFLPGVLCVAQGHRITSYGSWHAYEKKEDRITYRHIPQDRLWMESSLHWLQPCTFCSDPTELVNLACYRLTQVLHTNR